MWALIFDSEGDEIPRFPFLFIEVIEVARNDGSLLVEVPALGIVFVDDGEVLRIDM